MRIILADHNQKAVWALRTLLDEEDNMEVVGEVVNSECLQVLAEQTGADLVLVDRQLPNGDIASVVAKLQALVPKPFIILMSTDQADSRLSFRVGADAFVSKGEHPEWLLETLRRYAGRNSQVTKTD